MIIELVGLPGAGKSTFGRKLAHLKKYKKIKITSIWELCWFNVSFFFHHPITFFRLFVLYLTYAGSQDLWYTKFMSVFLDYNAKYMKAQQYSYALLDQGHLQVLLSLPDTTLPEKEISRILRYLPKADHYIFFDISKEIRQQRLSERKNVPRQWMPKQAWEKWQEATGNNYVSLISLVGELAPATIDVIENDADIKVVALQYHSAKFMRYITFARMPTEKAHGLQIAKMCEAFDQAGAHVSLVTPKRRNYIQSTVTSYYGLKMALQHLEAPVFDIIGYTKKVRPVHHYVHEFLFAWRVLWMHIPQEMIVYTRSVAVAFVCGLRGKKVIAEQHFWPNTGSRLHAFMLSYATHIPCNSEGTYDACLQHGLPQAFVAHNGFDVSVLEESISQLEARNNLHIPTDGKVAMYIGSLVGWKGVDTFCSVAEELKGEITIVVIGGKLDELEVWRQKYPDVLFIGPRPYSEIGKNQKAADVLVVPNNPITRESNEYTSPIKLFAHMASGVPILVSDLPAMRNILSEDTAFFFTAGNAESLKESIEYITQHSDEAFNRAQNARKKSTEYTWVNRAKNILIKFKNHI